LNYGSKILNDIGGLINLFEPHCKDRTTLATLKTMLNDRNEWRKAHALFGKIRDKTNRARSRESECQYLFEEICAKTLYNLSDSNAPFDSDSPYWIIPNAISLARRLGISDAECINVVMARP